jgi:ATP-dependent Lhr-like helicase
MGFVTESEAITWREWLLQLASQDRVKHEQGRWFAVDGTTDPKQILLGRLEAIGPVEPDDPRISWQGQESSHLAALEQEGAILRTRLDGRPAWCERRLLARIHRYTLERLRREIEPVTVNEFLQFLARWQHVDEEYRLEGPRGVREVLRQLAGFEIPASAWESHVLSRRVRDYRREWLDDLTLSGDFVWGRLWGSGASPIRVTPLSFVPRDDLDQWLAMTQPPPRDGLSSAAADVLAILSTQGAMFVQNLIKAANLLPSYVDMALAELLAHGCVTCDSFASLRQLITPRSRRTRPVQSRGRWSCFRVETPSCAVEEFAARQLLQRTGIVFRRMLVRERLPLSWSALIRVYRRLELRGEIRGGRFVAGFSGEQYALPEAVELLRKRRGGEREPISVFSADPLNLQGILTPDPRVPPTTRRQVVIG